MFLDFFFELRRRKVPVSTHEWMALMQALSLGLHDSSLDGFYQLSRAVCVKDTAHYDAFDQAFLSVFRGIEAASLALTDELLAWLRDPRHLEALTEEQRARLKALSLEELRQLFEQRLREQKERHDGGSRWVGTGGTSPFGSGGQHPSGMRVGEGGGRSALQIAGERRFRAYRSDEVLDVRKIDVALRLLRDLGRDGAADELDLDDTIDRTARNAGDLEVVMHPPRRNRIKVTLLMDVGGSMDPYALLCSRLFTAASRSGRFARFRSFYFHNCVYDAVYQDAHFRDSITVADLVGSSDREERLVIVGDAAMHPGELLNPGGSIYYYGHQSTATAGIEWMRRIAEHFRKSAWLNPEPTTAWDMPTVEILRKLFPMFPLSLEGLEAAVRHLTR
jgi:uncharacterized protein with von Willebrand factor type A (vWA) domain